MTRALPEDASGEAAPAAASLPGRADAVPPWAAPPWRRWPLARRIDAWWRARSPNVRGAIWITLGALLAAAMAATVKTLGQQLDFFQVVFFRCAFALTALTPFVWRAGGVASLRTRRLPLHLLRGLFGMTAMMCGFYAVTHLALADATAMTFTKPLFTIVLAVLFLGEMVRWRRWSATAVGFVGVLIMVRPGQHGVEAAVLVALFGSAMVAASTIVVKKLTTSETPTSILTYFGVFTTVVALGPAIAVWQSPTLVQLGMGAAIGALGALGQSCLIRGYRIGEATAVTPFDYTRLIFSGLFGFLLFAEVPDLWTLAGAAVVIGSTLYIARREADLGRPRRRDEMGYVVRN